MTAKVAADGFVIRRLRDNLGYNPLKDEWYFRGYFSAPKSSLTRSGCGRHSWDEEQENFKESLRKKRNRLVNVSDRPQDVSPLPEVSEVWNTWGTHS